MSMKLLMGSALLMALVGCSGTKNEVTVTGNDQQSLTTSPAGVATMTFVDLEGGFRVDQLPIAAPNGDALMLVQPDAPAAACTSTVTSTSGSTVTTTVTFSACKAANGNTTNGTMTLVYTLPTSGTVRSVTTTYNLTNADSTGKKTWSYTGTKVFTHDPTNKTASITVPNGGTGVTVSYRDADNSANNKTYTYIPNLSANWATVGQFKLWGSYSFSQGTASTITATIPQASPLIWTYGVGGCCYPTSGTLTLTTGGMTAEAVFGPTCGGLKLNGGAIAMPAC